MRLGERLAMQEKKYLYTAEEKFIIWLDGFEGLTYRQKSAVLSRFSSANAFVRAMRDGREELLRLVPEEMLCRMAGSLQDGEYLPSLLSKLTKKGIFCVTLRSADYPASLRAVPAPPLLLYCKGDKTLLREDKFAIVGSRRTLAWAQSLTREFAAGLSEHFAVVTGIAEGGDISAVKGALEGRKSRAEERARLICVLAHGMEYVYPSAHTDILREVASCGLVLSEHRPEVAPQKFLFPVRNRIIAGLSRGVLVVSGGLRSGTSITAGYALEYGRDVFAFPYNPGIASGAGCNALLKSGAAPADCLQDIFSWYGFEQKKASMPALSEEEEKIMRLLASCGEAHVGEICAQTGIPVFRAGGLLSGLEIKGMVARAGGNRYAAVGSFLSAREKETETNESRETSERQGVPRRAK